MAQQTAIDWLVKELKLEGYDYTIQQAKAMEKEQIMKAVYDTMEFDPNIEIAEKYYNETYKKKL